MGMCGLFGVLRSQRAAHPERASDALVVLGTVAGGHGRDSSGLALLTGRPVRAAVDGLRGAARPHGDVSLDGCRVVRGRGGFSGIWSPGLLDLLDHAPIVLGHIRRPVPGAPYTLNDAGPWLVDAPGGGVVATHDGEVEPPGPRERCRPPSLVDGGEPIFQPLAGCRDIDAMTAVLGGLVGRAALAWIDRARPDRVHLARAAVSPLTVAVDTEANFYWASNPRWFREVERHTVVRFAGAVLLREGTYLQIGRGSRRTGPEILERAEFLPTARPADLDERVWAGFTPADRAIDRTQTRHRIHTAGTGEFAIA